MREILLLTIILAIALFAKYNYHKVKLPNGYYMRHEEYNTNIYDDDSNLVLHRVMGFNVHNGFVYGWFIDKNENINFILNTMRKRKLIIDDYKEFNSILSKKGLPKSDISTEMTFGDLITGRIKKTW